MNKMAILNNVFFEDLGLIEYSQAFAIQKKAVEEVMAGGAPRLFVCEHPAVITIGRMSRDENFLLDKDEIRKRGVEIITVDRGGDLTLHSPGQLVVYPILNLNLHGKDLHRYLNNLEQVAIDLLSDFGIVADRFSGRTGAWVGNKKIASIGVGVRRWVSYHGIGINVNTDLELFKLIRPCGLNVSMTSMANIMGHPINMSDVKKSCFNHIKKIFRIDS